MNVTFCDVQASIQSQATNKIIVKTGPAPDFFSNCDVKIVTTGFGTLTHTNVFSYNAGMLISCPGFCSCTSDVPTFALNSVPVFQNTPQTGNIDIDAHITTREITCDIVCAKGTVSVNSGSPSSTIQVKGTLPQLQAMSITYTPEHDFVGSTTITVTTRYSDLPADCMYHCMSDVMSCNDTNVCNSNNCECGSDSDSRKSETILHCKPD